MAVHDTSLELYHRTQTAVEIRAQVNLIQEVMRSVMHEGTHFGVIPGCQKPSLWKPGAEVLFATFRVSVDPIVDDLSTFNEARFRVTARGTSNHGLQLGSAVGEASSDEEKYKWREVVCQEEWDATPEDQRRLKWKRSKTSNYSIQQVRTNIADCRNTILKMAVKRAEVALALKVTAASDIFTQDIEDVPEESRAAVVDETTDAPAPLPTEIKRKEPATVTAPQAPAPPVRPVQTVQPPRPPIQSPKPATVRTISEAQGRRFYAIWKSAGRTQEQVKEYLQSKCGVGSDREMPADKYEAACRWAETGDDF